MQRVRPRQAVRSVCYHRYVCVYTRRLCMPRVAHDPRHTHTRTHAQLDFGYWPPSQVDHTTEASAAEATTHRSSSHPRSICLALLCIQPRARRRPGGLCSHLGPTRTKGESGRASFRSPTPGQRTRHAPRQGIMAALAGARGTVPTRTNDGDTARRRARNQVTTICHLCRAVLIV